MPKILSTMTAGNDYLIYAEGAGNGPNVILDRISIKGGANVASSPHALASGLLTPGHAITEVTDEQLDRLKKNDHFMFHMKGGFLKILDSGESDKAVKAAVKDMEAKDAAAPLTPADYEEGGRAQVNKPKTDEDGGGITEVKAKTGKAKA